jgi:hypothetical protein
MTRRCFLAALPPLGALAVMAIGFAQNPTDPPAANKENIEAALKLTQAAAAEYEFRVGTEEKPLELQREPVLRWSNPDRGEVHGNVFVWTRDGRPLVVGSLFKWFTPHTHMSHEFHSLAEEGFTAKFHGKDVWKMTEAGLRFADVPNAPAPADTDAQRLLQMKQLAKDFTADKTEREDVNPTELRLLPQPVYRYSAPKQGVLGGGLFALVHGTDPEIWVLIEARGKDAAGARWQFAAARMNSVQMNLRYKGQKVWSVETLPWKDIQDHKLVYTTFGFKELPDFLKDTLPKPKK